MLDRRGIAALLVLTLAPVVWADNFQKGLDAYSSADYEAAFAIWQPLAESGDAGSQYGLGMMYGNGFGVTMDDALALKWYGSASEHGHSGAQCNLAVMYQNGWGVAPDEAEAVRLYTLAANQGVGNAMSALGRHFSMDFSEAYDPVMAYKWLSLAALLNEMDANVKRDLIADKMTPEQLAEGNALKDAWSTEHAELLTPQ